MRPQAALDLEAHQDHQENPGLSVPQESPASQPKASPSPPENLEKPATKDLQVHQVPQDRPAPTARPDQPDRKENPAQTELQAKTAKPDLLDHQVAPERLARRASAPSTAPSTEASSSRTAPDDKRHATLSSHHERQNAVFSNAPLSLCLYVILRILLVSSPVAAVDLRLKSMV